MNMLKLIYKGGAVMALLTIAACSADTFTEGSLTLGDIPIVLNGTLTRTTGESEKGELKPLTGYTDLKLSAKYEGTFFFKNQAITVKDADGADKNKLETTVRYPAGNKEIGLFAHTGDVNDNEILTLKSGTKTENDILLSNGTGADEGTGTKGSSETNAQLLTFRHAMTKITIEADYSLDNQLQETRPTKITIKFGNKVPIQGTIAITSKLSDNTTKATAATGDTGYALTLGDNYVVPTGETLSGTNIITELKIDDYTATSDDKKGMEIKPDDNSKPFLLAPGLSYKLTLKIKRLKVVGIILKKQDWNIQKGNGDWGYTPYKVAMNFTGGYTNSNTDADARISKIVLKHTAAGGEQYQYVGGVDKDGNIDFVTLPSSVATPSTDLSADLYTKNGLLVEDIKPTGYTAPNNGFSGSLAITLGANGMNKNGDYYEVTTPLQFYNMMKNPTADKYKLMKNIDMNSLPLAYEPKEWISGAELNGNGCFILHLNLDGSGLVTENNGTLKNIHIGPGKITSTADYTGGLCSINNGIIEACVNEADIVSPDGKTAGGICGKNSGTILACLNTGNIETGENVGGICGENTNSTGSDVIKGCINAGMLNKNATNLGGICGTSAINTNTIVNSCYWLTGTARPVQQVNSEVAIGNDRSQEQTFVVNSADLAPEKLRGEAVTKINTAITGSKWEFKWEQNSDGTYPCVWPVPVIR